jgi:hypothetical protein
MIGEVLRLLRIRRDEFSKIGGVVVLKHLAVLDFKINLLASILQVIDTEIKRGATEEEAGLQGARKALDFYRQISQEARAYPQIGKDAYNILPPEEIAARQNLLARAKALLWVMGDPSGEIF